MTVTTLAIVATVALTSILSGTLGMGGGIILMGVLTLVLPVPAAMLLHGIAQLAANGSRAVLHRQHVAMHVLGIYACGAALSLIAFASTRVVTEKWLVYILLGIFPYLAILVPKMRELDVTRRSHAFLCGAVVCALQLLAGASGPVLDVFFLNGRLTKHEVVATKAATQSLSHALKLVYYGLLVTSGFEQATEVTGGIWIYGAVIVLGIVGSVVGGRVLARMSDATFQRASRVLVMGIGAVYLVKGVMALAS